jgi:hypothetical protein
MKKIERKIKRKRIKAYLGRLLHSWPTKSITPARPTLPLAPGGPRPPFLPRAVTLACGPHCPVTQLARALTAVWDRVVGLIVTATLGRFSRFRPQRPPRIRRSRITDPAPSLLPLKNRRRDTLARADFSANHPVSNLFIERGESRKRAGRAAAIQTRGVRRRCSNCVVCKVDRGKRL